MWMRAFLGGFLFSLVVLACGAVAQEPERTEIEFVEPRATTAPSRLGTKSYEPSAAEKKHYQALSPEEQRPMAIMKPYELSKRDGVEVSWFGIVREIEEDAESKTTRLLVEHKYFDGLTDLHMQVVSFNGSGDFEATLQGVELGIRELALVRVYGTAKVDATGVSIPKVAFLRHWDWGSFAFIGAFGIQRGSEDWRKLLRVDLKKIYSSNPDESYYVERLGPRPEPEGGAVLEFRVLLKEEEVDGKLRRLIHHEPLDGSTIESQDMVAHLRNEGIRRRDRRRPGDSGRALVRVRLSSEPSLPAARVLGLKSFGGRQDVGIDTFEFVTEDGTTIPVWTSESMPRQIEPRSCPHLEIEGPRLRADWHPDDEVGERTVRIKAGAYDREGSAIEVADLDAEIEKLAAKNPLHLIVVYKGSVRMGELVDLVGKARAAGIAEVGISDGMTFGLSSSDWRQRVASVSLESLLPQVESVIAGAPDLLNDDYLWFEVEDDDATSLLKSGTVQGSALILAGLAWHGRMDHDAERLDRMQNVLQAVIERIPRKIEKENFSLRDQAWLLFALVEIGAYTGAPDLEAVIPRLINDFRRSQLPGGGWPDKVGGLEADLLTSALVAVAIRDAVAAELVETDRRELALESGWMSARTDPKTGYWRVSPEPLSISSIDAEGLQRMTLGNHPEYETVLAAAFRIARGEDPGSGILATQLDRIRDLPPQTDVATGYYDSVHALFAAWIMAQLDDPVWRDYGATLGAAISSHLVRSAPLREQGALGERLRRGRLLIEARIALTAGFMREYEPE